jgi:2-dehydro-3-deoxygluconokinase
MADPRFDFTTVGETMLRLSVPEGERLERVEHLDVWPGGAESNVAVALSRMGFRAAWFSRLPDSPLGRRIGWAIHAGGVDTSAVAWTDDGRVGTYFVEYAPPPRRIEVVYDRKDSAAAQMTPEHIPWEFLLNTRMLHLTGITPGLSSSCLAVTAEACDRARHAGITLSIDVNYRAKLWTPSEAAEALLPLLRRATLVICGEADAATLFGLEGEAEQVLRDLQRLTGSPMVVLTVGERGALAVTGDDKVLTQPAFPATIVDRIGAGDAFSAGVLCGLLEGSLEAGLRYGAAMSAHKLTTFGDMLCATRAEILELLVETQHRRPGR